MIDKNWTRAFLAVLGAAFLWSTSFVATKIALTAFAPMTLAAVRTTLATVLLGLVVIYKREFTKPTRRDFWFIFAGGMFGVTLYFFLENWGLKLSTAADGALLVGAFPVIALVLECAIFRTKLSWIRFLGAIIGIVGIFMIVGADPVEWDPKRLFGNILLILTGVSWTLYNFVTSPIVGRYPLMTTNFLQSLIGTVAIYPIAYFEPHNWSAVTLPAALCVAYLGVLCSVVAYIAYTYGLRRLDSTSAVSILNLIPVFGVVFSYLILDEKILFMQILGGLVIIVGVYLTVLHKPKVAPLPPT